MGVNGVREGKNVAMQYLAFYLSTEMGQTVVDETGLKGHYDFSGQWDLARGIVAAAPPPPPGFSGASPQELGRGTGTSVFDALRKQLGLRLEKAKVPATQIVIDHVEKLGEN